MPRIQRRFTRAAARSRGFTLIELSLVIVIVGIVAAISYPSTTGMIRNERRAQAQRGVATLITEARALAMGRGGSVLVRYPDPQGNIEVRQATVGTNAGGCTNVPDLGCTRPDRWDNDVESRYVDGVSVAPIATGMKVETPHGEIGTISLCFSPQGRTWAVLGTDDWAPLKGEVSFVSTDSKGIEHRVLVLPTGATRFITRNTQP